MTDLSAFFLLTLMTATYNHNKMDNTKTQLEAYSQQYKIEDITKSYIDQHLSLDLQSKIGDIYLVTNILTQRKIVYKASF